ncbi:hypothetical protein [Polaromonas sp. A23]|uniref:hypothetical protein n=1 Tax=Polaromonas sp. A23 TaxID=1944133 RepID=UPI000986F21E|nr:hypothetical protein [Polaromonas sp. A23]OOG41149.1 hypothetical protein B0B52_12480 [Polaromonas sp. A23]
MDSSHTPSIQDRLSQTRQAIVRQMRHENLDAVEHDEQDANEREIDASASTWHLAKQAAGAWWQNHPAHLAVTFAKPAMHTLAEERPLKLLGISAGLGAAVIVLRPWRLISLTGLVLAALRSSELAGFANSLLGSDRQNKRFR